MNIIKDAHQPGFDTESKEIEALAVCQGAHKRFLYKVFRTAWLSRKPPGHAVEAIQLG